MRIDREDVYRYMGLKKLSDEPLSPSVIAETDRVERLLLDSVKPAYVWRLFDLERSDSCGISESENKFLRLSGCGFALDGSSIAKHLEGCEKAAVIAVTLGTAADRFLKKTALPDGLSGLCADALASAYTEAALEEARGEVIRETGLFATWCFAAGYGDFPLDTAQKLLTCVDAQRRIGLSVTGSGMLTPQKSIVGVIGLSDREIPGERRSCSDCSMYENCKFRRSGEYRNNR